ncbi:MAG TPA: hypothetical protein VFT19_03320 [Solirubrobacterales bacterium]|nr:hypothetical protein [Solirubrobacterales bacterium]
MPGDEIIIMANSLKWGGRCVAGISVRSGAWVRPVSTRPHGELYPFQYCIDGREAELFDVVGFEHEGSTGDPTQPENVQVGDSRWWRTGRVGREEAARALGSHRIEGPVLLGNRGKALPEDEAERGVEASLALVEPGRIEFRLDPPLEGTAKRRPRVEFDLGGETYTLSMTDTAVRPRLLRAGLGRHDPSEVGLGSDGPILLTVSLAEARDGWCTKLVAAAFTLPKGG